MTAQTNGTPPRSPDSGLQTPDSYDSWIDDCIRDFDDRHQVTVDFDGRSREEAHEERADREPIEESDMTASAELLEAMIDDERLMTREQLAHLWRISRRAVAKKIAGQSHTSIEQWNILLEETGDHRIIGLLFNRTDFGVFEMPSAELLSGREGVSYAHKMLSHFLTQANGWTTHVLEIVRDGRVDQKDLDLIHRMAQKAPEVICAIRSAQALIEQLYKRQTGREAMGEVPFADLPAPGPGDTRTEGVPVA